MNFLLTWSKAYGGLVLDKEDFKAFWAGRPQMKPLGYLGRAYHSFGLTAVTVARVDKLRAQGRLEHAK